MQLVGEVLGQVSDTLNKAGVWGFDETSVVGNVGRDLIEAGGTAAIAAATGLVSNAITHGAYQLAGGNMELATGIANAGNNLVAAAVGGGVGSAAGGGFANGAAIASTIEEYNLNFSKLTEKRIRQINKEALAAGAVSGTVGAVIGSAVGTGAVAVVGPGVVATTPGGEAIGATIGAIGGYLVTAGSEIISAVWEGDEDNTSAMTAPPQPTKDDTTLSTPNQNRDPKDNVLSTPAQEHDPKDNMLSTPAQESDAKDNILSTPAQTPDKGDMVVTDNNSGTLEGTKQDLIDLIGPSASLGKNDVIEIDGNGDQNQTAQDVVDKIIGNREVDQEKSKDLNPINGVAGSKAIHLTDGTVITYRPAGAASSKTDKSTATIQVKNPSMGNGKTIKMKVK